MNLIEKYKGKNNLDLLDNKG